MAVSKSFCVLKSRTLFMKFVLLCGIVTFAVVILNCGQTSLMPNNELIKADQRLDHLVYSTPKYETTPDKRSPLSVRGNQTLDRKIDPGRLRTNYQTKVTALIYSREESPDCFRQRIRSVFAHFPNITLIAASSKSVESTFFNVEILTDVPHEGEAMEMMLAKVKTEYFLYLASGVSLAGNDISSSVIWLFHALQNVPRLDFVGGSYVRHNPGSKYPTLEIPCYRLRQCNWTMSQSFEYQYSIGDMMVCEETSSSFMGRMSSLAKVGHFDSYLTIMATTDFFLRAKGRALVGLRPEVKFVQTAPCLEKHLTASNEADIKFPFIRKHQLLVLKDSFRKEVKAIDSKYYFSIDYHKKPSTYGNPFRTQGILRSLEVAADFLESEGIPYYVDAGTSLGAVKMRGILPWDLDADLQFYADRRLVKRGLERFIKQRGIEGHVEAYITSRGQFTLRLFTGVIGFVELYEIPKAVPPSKRFLYIDLHGRQYPIEEVLFSSLRRQYGNTFLEMWPNYGRPRKCVFQKDHHSCLPEEFMQGGGHWRDYYCEL